MLEYDDSSMKLVAAGLRRGNSPNCHTAPLRALYIDAMEETATNKRLHFIVRDDRYLHVAGYGYFLDHVLKQLNREEPAWARELLERTALILQNPADENQPQGNPKSQPKNIEVLLNSLPKPMRERLKLTPAFFDEKTVLGRSNLNIYFGSVASSDFGVLFPRRLVTVIDSKDEAFGRSYSRTLAEHYGARALAKPEEVHLTFSYPIPGTNETLSLMKIGSPKNLEADYTARDANKQAKRDPESIFYNPNTRLVFLHPQCDRAFFNKLIACIDPLLAQVDAPSAPFPAPGTPPPADKQAAVATIYWLLAQSTPITRGGSAYANVILEHLAHRLRQQGYDYEIPYLKEGVDLWAQAAVLPLEDTPERQGFKTRFLEGKFFDRATKDADMEQYFCEALQRAAAAREAMYVKNIRHAENMLHYQALIGVR